VNKKHDLLLTQVKFEATGTCTKVVSINFCCTYINVVFLN